MPTGEKTSGLAIGALISGIIGFFVTIIFLLPIILGHLALSEIRKNPDLGGRGMALAGLILGYIEGGLVIIAIMAFCLFMALGQQVKGSFQTINTQIQQAQDSK